MEGLATDLGLLTPAGVHELFKLVIVRPGVEGRDDIGPWYREGKIRREQHFIEYIVTGLRTTYRVRFYDNFTLSMDVKYHSANRYRKAGRIRNKIAVLTTLKSIIEIDPQGKLICYIQEPNGDIKKSAEITASLLANDYLPTYGEVLTFMELDGIPMQVIALETAFYELGIKTHVVTVRKFY